MGAALARLLALALIVGVGVAAVAAPADAHAVLQETDPGSGAVLADPPNQVTLRFNEAVSVGDRAVRVLDAQGGVVTAGSTTAAGPTVTLVLGETLARGSYVVSWKVTSADSHVATGAFSFAVGAPSAAGTDAAAIASAEAANATTGGARDFRDLATALTYLGSLLALGATAFLVWMAPGSAPDRVRPVQGLVVGGAVAGVVGLAADVVAQALLISGTGLVVPAWAAIVDQASGPLGFQAAMGWAGLVLTVAAAFSPPTRSTLAASSAGAALVAVGLVAVGHTRVASPQWLTAAADLTHIVAGAVWTGGLVALVVYLRWSPALLSDHDDIDDAWAAADDDGWVVARFSGWAGASLAAVVIAGSILTWRIAGSVGALLHTGWGVLLLVKIGLVSVVALIGGYNRFALVGRLRPTDDRVPVGHHRRLGRMLRTEAGIVLVVVGITAVLTSTSPEPEPAPTITPVSPGSPGLLAAASAPSTVPGPQGADPFSCEAMRAEPGMADMACEAHPTGSTVVVAAFGTGTAAIAVLPGRAGSNRFIVTLHDSSDAPIEPHASPTVEFRLAGADVGPFVATAEPLGDGLFTVVQDLVIAGEWQVTVSANVTEFDQLRATVSLTIEP